MGHVIAMDDYYARVKKDIAAQHKELLKSIGILDRGRKVLYDGDFVLFPVTQEFAGIEMVKVEGGVRSESARTPYEAMIGLAKGLLPPDMSIFLPRRWEKLGDSVLLKIPTQLYEYKNSVGRIYAEALNVKAVYHYGEIVGKKRLPTAELVYGNGGDVIHVENGVKFLLNPSRVMFSSGNLKERMRMAKIARSDDVVVDMFAGIGYFSIPIAFRAERIYAIEFNRTAYEYLCKNIEINGLKNVEPIFGDNREVTPKRVASRVIMGYLDAAEYLPVAISSLSGDGVIHYHCLRRTELIGELPAEIKKCADELGYEVVDYKMNRIKSYAPRVMHLVYDLRMKRYL